MELLHLYSYSIVCCWRLWMSNFQLIRFCSESAAPHPEPCVCEAVWGMPWECLGPLKCCWLAPLEKTYRGVWGQSLALWTEETQHCCCSWFALLALQGPSIISTWQQLQVVKQGWHCNIPTLIGNEMQCTGREEWEGRIGVTAMCDMVAHWDPFTLFQVLLNVS